ADTFRADFVPADRLDGPAARRGGVRAGASRIRGPAAGCVRAAPVLRSATRLAGWWVLLMVCRALAGHGGSDLCREAPAEQRGDGNPGRVLRSQWGGLRSPELCGGGRPAAGRTEPAGRLRE